MPPYSSGKGSPNRPIPAIWSRTSSSSSSARSMASARGATTVWANSWTILRNSSCSGVSVKSIPAPSWGGVVAGASGARRHASRPRRDPCRDPAKATRSPSRDPAAATEGPAGSRQGDPGPKQGSRRSTRWGASGGELSSGSPPDQSGPVLQAEQGEVVEAAAGAVPVGRGDQLVEGVVERGAAQRPLQQAAVDEAAPGVAHLDQPVGVADQPLAGPQRALRLEGAGAEPQRRPHPGDARTGPEREGMAGRGEHHPAVAVGTADQGGDEVLVAALARDQPVEAAEDAGRPDALAGQRAEGALEHRRQRAGLQALAARVGQDEGDALAVPDLDHVVEVAADLRQPAGRLVAHPDLPAGDPAGRGGQQQRLDPFEHLGLGAGTLRAGDGTGAEAGELLRGLKLLLGQARVGAAPGQRDGAGLAPGRVDQRQPQHAAEAARLQHGRLRRDQGADAGLEGPGG